MVLRSLVELYKLYHIVCKHNIGQENRIDKSFAIGIQCFVSEHVCTYYIVLVVKVPPVVPFPKLAIFYVLIAHGRDLELRRTQRR